jgi:hypothetical protein
MPWTLQSEGLPTLLATAARCSTRPAEIGGDQEMERSPLAPDGVAWL